MEKVKNIAAEIDAGKDMPPIIVFQEGGLLMATIAISDMSMLRLKQSFAI